jgi:hypothetical protein
MKTIAIIVGIILTCALSLRAQIQTLVVSPTNILSSVITVPTNGYAVVKSVDYDDGGQLLINAQGVNFSKDLTTSTLTGLTIAGPATIQLAAQPSAYYASYATIELQEQPDPFPANQTFTVGSNAGNVQVTMLTSTDLINWSPATNGMVYTNTPAARFFRIQMIVNP